jgi:hypothetical protein
MGRLKVARSSEERMFKIVTRGAVSVLVTAVLLVSCAAPASYAAPKPVHKVPAKPGTLGTTQMAGGDGQIGQTYTLTDDNGYGPFNFTIKSMEYSVAPINMAPGNSCAPKVDEKLLVIHYRIKNPNKDDFYYSGNPFFQTVDANNETKDASGNVRRESEHDVIGVQVKPGQGIDDLITYAVVTAKGPLPKVILKYKRVGTHDEVTRFPLGTGANVVKPIPAPYADPSDPTGATPLAVIPAKIAMPYVAGFFGISLDSVAYAPGPFGDKTADDGKQFLVATVTVTNKTWDKIYFKDTLAAILKTDDDEKTTDYAMLKGKRDEGFDGDEFLPDEPHTIRLLFQIPKDAKAKTLSLAENVDNSGGISRAFLYDLSDLK